MARYYIIEQAVIERAWIVEGDNEDQAMDAYGRGETELAWDEGAFPPADWEFDQIEEAGE